MTGLLEIGRISKPHGLRGEVVVALTTDRLERVAPGSVLIARERTLVVSASRPHQHRFIVTFEGVEGRTAAEALAGAPLMAEPLDDDDALWVHDVVGTLVREERSGVDRGTVIAVLANPAHDILELDTGALVPVVFVTSSAEGVTLIDPPDGLFEVD